MGQTRWAAGRLSARISDNSEYRLSIGKITHSWSQPDQIALEDVQLARNGQPQALVANRVDLGLSLRQITEPRYFHSVTLRDGTLNVQPQAAALPVQADVLQLSNMALQSNDSKWQLNAQQVTAGITPRRAGRPSVGDNNQFQFSAGSMTLNGIPASKVLVQGSKNRACCC